MLVEDLIESLGDETASITDILLKTKVLLFKIGQTEPVAWVNNELNGYPEGAVLPPYRQLHSRVLANIASMTWRASSHPIPIGHLKPEQRKQLELSEVFESLAVIAELVAKDDGSLMKPLPMELNGVLGKSLSSGAHIQQAWCDISRADMKNILFQVRSRLLDFMLELQSKLGTSVTAENIKEKANAANATALFSRAIFGPGATIILGDQKNQNIQINNPPGDIEALVAAMTRLGFPDDELLNLRIAIQADKTEKGTASFEGKTGAWLSGIIGRAAKGAVNVGVDVASSTAAKLLASFMGM